MALINLENESDPWIFEHDSCERLQKDILEQFDLRSRERKYSDQHSRLSAAIRLRMKQYDTEVQQLKSKNDQAFQRRTITRQEHERRLRLVEALQSKYIFMTSLFNQQQNKSDDRNRLLGTAPGTSVQEVGTVDWGTCDDDVPPINSSNYSINDVRKQQQDIMEEQNRGLEQLSNIIARQKNIAETIHTEVNLQNELVDNLGDNMDRTNERVRNETRNVEVIDRKDSTCGYWLLIVSLFFCILIVSWF